MPHFDKMSVKALLNTENIPQHVAIIMDGNGRWAKQKGQERLFGHAMGVESVREALKAATEVGVKYLTLYAFSTENWNRPVDEVNGLMTLLVDTLTKEIKSLKENNVIVKTIGNIDALPGNCGTELHEACLSTQNNSGTTLILALNYSGRTELIDGIKSIAEKYKNGAIELDDICTVLVHQSLYTHDTPDPELVIRTSGEQRISNFLLWQVAYSEFYFTETLWPDFKQEDFFKAIYNYQNRERRFGMISEQIKQH